MSSLSAGDFFQRGRRQFTCFKNSTNQVEKCHIFSGKKRTALQFVVFFPIIKESKLTCKHLKKYQAKRHITKAAGIFRDSGSQGSYSPDDLERDYFISHTPKVGSVSKCNGTSFSFIKYLDNWKVLVNGNLFQL